jgi:hypothetical protein
MRIVPAAPVPAKTASVPASRGPMSPTAIVCAALMLAVVFLAFRIADGLVSSAFPDCSLIGDSVPTCSTP